MSDLYITRITDYPAGIEIKIGPDDHKYQIYPTTSYDDVIDGDISDWVHQVMGKTWADIDSLYRLGAILSKHTVGSRINWTKTFLMVERWNAFEEESERRDTEKVLDAIENQIPFKMDSISEAIDLGQELRNDEELQEKLKKQVEEKLVQYGFTLS